MAMAVALAAAVNTTVFAQEPVSPATAPENPAILQTLSVQEASSVFGAENGAVQLAMLSEEEMTTTTGARTWWDRRFGGGNWRRTFKIDCDIILNPDNSVSGGC